FAGQVEVGRAAEGRVEDVQAAVHAQEGQFAVAAPQAEPFLVRACARRGSGLAQKDEAVYPGQHFVPGLAGGRHLNRDVGPSCRLDGSTITGRPEVAPPAQLVRRAVQTINADTRSKSGRRHGGILSSKKDHGNHPMPPHSPDGTFNPWAMENEYTPPTLRCKQNWEKNSSPVPKRAGPRTGTKPHPDRARTAHPLQAIVAATRLGAPE